MEPITDLRQITVEVLDQYAAEAEEQRLERLIRSKIKNLGKEYRASYARTFNLEVRCKLRAIELASLGFPKSELMELFGVPRRVINKWLR